MLTKEEQVVILGQNQWLETERLILRPVTLADANDMYEYASDAETVRYVFPRHETVADTQASIIDFFIKDPLEKFGIELKSTNKFIGTIDLRINALHPKGVLGYTLNKAYWGQGIIPEAAKTLLEFGFEKLELIRIEAIHDQRNPKSGRVMEKIGMRKEGLLRNHMILKGEVVDDWLYALTSEDYWEQKGE